MFHAADRRACSEPDFFQPARLLRLSPVMTIHVKSVRVSMSIRVSDLTDWGRNSGWQGPCLLQRERICSPKTQLCSTLVLRYAVQEDAFGLPFCHPGPDRTLRMVRGQELHVP